MTSSLFEVHGLIAHVLVFLRPGGIPVDTYGEKQRTQLREAFLGKCSRAGLADDCCCWTNTLLAAKCLKGALHKVLAKVARKRCLQTMLAKPSAPVGTPLPTAYLYACACLFSRSPLSAGGVTLPRMVVFNHKL